MATASKRVAEINRALAIKRNNAITAVLAGSGLAAVVLWLYGFGPLKFGPFALALGAASGVFYANAFEYVLHRFFLHWGEGFLVQRHALHHNSAGADDEARFINFASSSWVVVLVFALNAPAVFAAQFCIHACSGNFPAGSFSSVSLGSGAFGAGMSAGFTIYYVVYETVHWRIHMGGWLPRWMRFARRHHMLHHGDSEGHYSVFLPIFDWLFTRLEGKRSVPSPR